VAKRVKPTGRKARQSSKAFDTEKEPIYDIEATVI
jgi:hypothetical protein